MRLDGKVTVITGAGGSLGRAMAQLFGREGAELTLVEINQKAGEETLSMVKSQGIDAILVPTDVTNDDDIGRMVKATLDKYGRIDGLVNIAGVTPVYPALETPVEVWDQTFNLNIKSHFLMARRIVPVMVEGGGGSIVNIGSVLGLYGSRATPVYGATKAAVAHFTRSLCVAHRAQNIRVNCMMCGGIDNSHSRTAIQAMVDWTKAHPDQPPLTSTSAVAAAAPQTDAPRRIGQPEEYAKVALFLISDDASWVNGSVIVVDGGGVAGTA